MDSKKLPDTVIRYGLFEEDHLALVRYPEAINEIQVTSFMEFIHASLCNKPVKMALIDFRHSKFKFSVSVLKNLSSQRKSIFKDLHSVLLVNDEMQTAYSVLFAIWVKYVDVCSTMDYAIRLLDLKKNSIEIEEAMANPTCEYNCEKVS